MNNSPFVSSLMLMASVAVAQESQTLSDGLVRSLVAREPMLKNPVAVSVDTDGAIYVAETARRVTSDLDIRQFKSWVPKTLEMRTVEDRLKFYRSELLPGKLAPNSQLKDLNNDGVVDIRDTTVVSEKIHRLIDSNGDGVADQSSVFADGFQTEVTGVAAGVFAWRGDVYATIVPDVWKLRDTEGKGQATQREVLATGFGVHIAYAGHDMHGLTLGPDGRIYWTIGDKGANVVSKEGKRFAEPHAGSLFRCYPDGSGFEVYAHGLRNVQQFAFDDYGNIFGVDNDSDQKGEKERFVFIAEGSDTGWRCFYQYRGNDYNPWMAESMSVPSGKDQPAYLTPALSSYVDGPSGFARDPGTALNERYRGAYFMTGFPAGLLYSFKVEPNGAGFRMKDSHVVDKGPFYTGCNFGPDGALYLADWAGGYPLKEKGAVWKLDDPKEKDNPMRRETAAWLKDGPGKVSDAELLKRLSHPDQRIRCDAQGELALRPGGPELLVKAATESKDAPLACTHALWGLTQAGKYSPELFQTLIAAKPEQTRAQAAKWAGETAKRPVAELIPLLKDPSSVVRYRTAIAIGKLGMSEAADAVCAMLAENANSDAFLRHAGVIALTGMKPEAVQRAARHESAAVRLAAAVVFRRTASREVTALLADADSAVVNEAAHSIYDDEGIADALPALAALLEKRPDAAAPTLRRSIATNRALGDEAAAGRLVSYAANTARPAELRLAALNSLASWTTNVSLDAVDGRWHPIAPSDSTPARNAYQGVAAQLLRDPSTDIAKAAKRAAKALGIPEDPALLAKEAADATHPVEDRLEALASLKSNARERFQSIAPALLTAASVELRIGAANLLESGPEVLTYALSAAQGAKSVKERQNAILILGNSNDPKAVEVLKSLLGQAVNTPETQLDLLTAAKAPEVKIAADSFRTVLTQKGEIGPFLPSLAGGNAGRGKEVFETHLAAQCIACHRLGTEGSNVGPVLAKVGAKGRDYILESIVLPQAKIAPGFGILTVTKKDGSIVTGAPKSEDATTLVMLMPDGKEQAVPLTEVTSRTPVISSMPPMGAILKPSEIRDLVEFLSGLK